MYLCLKLLSISDIHVLLLNHLLIHVLLLLDIHHLIDTLIKSRIFPLFSFFSFFFSITFFLCFNAF